MENSERHRKWKKILEQLDRDAHRDGAAFDETFTGHLCFDFNIQTGGISGTVKITKESRPAQA